MLQGLGCDTQPPHKQGVPHLSLVGGAKSGSALMSAVLHPPSLRSSSSKLAQLTLEQILEHLDNLRLNLTNTKQNCTYPRLRHRQRPRGAVSKMDVEGGFPCLGGTHP